MGGQPGTLRPWRESEVDTGLGPSLLLTWLRPCGRERGSALSGSCVSGGKVQLLLDSLDSRPCSVHCPGFPRSRLTCLLSKLPDCTQHSNLRLLAQLHFSEPLVNTISQGENREESKEDRFFLAAETPRGQLGTATEPSLGTLRRRPLVYLTYSGRTSKMSLSVADEKTVRPYEKCKLYPAPRQVSSAGNQIQQVTRPQSHSSAPGGPGHRRPFFSL